MDDSTPKKFSYPNADQAIPGVTDSSRQAPETQFSKNDAGSSAADGRKPTINIIDALNAQKKDGNDIKNLRTYQEDITDAIRDDNVSMIKVALAEKKRQEKEGRSSQNLLEVDNTKKYVVLAGGVLVVLLFLIGGYFFISAKSASDQTIPVQAAPEALLYTEKFTNINIDQKDPSDITRLIKRELDNPLDLGSMETITLTTGDGASTTAVTSGEFFQAISARMPDSLIRSIDPRFMLGMYAFSPNDFFAIFKINSYDTAFAGMLQWEPYMEDDIGGIFITKKTIVPIDQVTQVAPSAPGSLAPSSTAPTSGSLFTNRLWIDRVEDNKDARVLVDTDGSPAMLYTFLDKDTLVIASSEKSLKEITFRLTAGRIVR